MNEYHVEISKTVGRPWIHKEPIRLGDVPRGLGTPDHYCTVSRDEEPYLLLCLYGSESYFAEARIWQPWLVVGFGCFIYFLSPEMPHRQIVFGSGYFCTLYPSDKYLLATSINNVLCFDQVAQLLWISEEVSLDGVSISSIQGDRIFGLAECPPWSNPYRRGSFTLSLQTGTVIE